MKDWSQKKKEFILFMLVAVAAVALLMVFFGNYNQKDAIIESDITPSQFFDDLEAGKIESVQFHKIDAKKLNGVYRELFEGKEHHFSVLLPAIPDYEFIENVRSYGVTIDKTKESGGGFLGFIASNIANNMTNQRTVYGVY